MPDSTFDDALNIIKKWKKENSKSDFNLDLYFKEYNTTIHNLEKELKEYKANPDAYKAHVGDVSTVLRVALTGRTNTPDMYEIMQVLGKESIEKRFRKVER